MISLHEMVFISPRACNGMWDQTAYTRMVSVLTYICGNYWNKLFGTVICAPVIIVK